MRARRVDATRSARRPPHVTAAVFVATYAIVAAGRAPFLRIDRTGAAVVGAILMLVTGAIGYAEAVQAVDVRTLVLLFSMMVIVAHLRLSGGLALLADLGSRSPCAGAGLKSPHP